MHFSLKANLQIQTISAESELIAPKSPEGDLNAVLIQQINSTFNFKGF